MRSQHILSRSSSRNRAPRGARFAADMNAGPSYSRAMHSDSSNALPPSIQAIESAAMPPQGMSSQAEARVLWTAGEGQVVNAGVFLVAALFFWLVLPVGWALYRYLKTARHRYTLTDQRLLEESGLIVKRVESLELYRVKDLSVAGTLLQTMVGRGRVILRTTDTSHPTAILNAVPNAVEVSQLIRNNVEACRAAKGVRAFDY